MVGELGSYQVDVFVGLQNDDLDHVVNHRFPFPHPSTTLKGKKNDGHRARETFCVLRVFTLIATAAQGLGRPAPAG